MAEFTTERISKLDETETSASFCARVSLLLNEKKPKSDEKLYRFITLQNGLKCLLISEEKVSSQSSCHESDSDSESVDGDLNDDECSNVSDSSDCESKDGKGEGTSSRRRAALAMAVGVGSYSDPKECQGLAHFLEHLLFMGSKKYPKENYFDEFVSSKGGFVNAYTQAEETVYYFTISQSGLFHAVDIISQFLVDPLLNKDAIDRELESIQSEFDSARMSDGNRCLELCSHTALDTHPASLFGWGNMDSIKNEPEALGVDPYMLLKEFYKKYYGSDNMSLVLMGEQPLDELETCVRKSFSNIRKSESGPHSHKMAGMPFLTNKTGKGSINRLFKIIPVKDTHTLYLTFQFPPLRPNYACKPEDYLSHLIGHESNGSILSVAKTKGWANSIMVGPDDNSTNTSFCIYNMKVGLTEKGLLEWVEVVALIFEYIGLLIKVGPQKWVCDELQKTAEMEYEYREDEDPDDFVTDLAENLLTFHSEYKCEDVLSAKYRTTEYRPELITALLKRLVPDQVRIDLVSSVFGRAGDYEDKEASEQTLSDEVSNLAIKDDARAKNEKPSSAPSVEPRFGTRFWVEDMKLEYVEYWKEALTSFYDAGTNKTKSGMTLPKPNLYIPSDLELFPFDPKEDRHPLIGAAIKMHTKVGKKMKWLLGFVVQYDSTKSLIQVAFDFESSWHIVQDAVTWKLWLMESRSNNQGSDDTVFFLDNGKTKCRLLSGGNGGAQQFTLENIWELCDHNPPFAECFSPKKHKKSSSTFTLWCLRDRVFLLPRAEIYLSFVFKDRYASSSPRNTVLLSMLIKMAKEALNEETYMASMAELDYYVSFSSYGVKFHFTGFNEKLLQLVRNVLNVFFSSTCLDTGISDHNSILEDRYKRVKEAMARSFSNSGLKSSSYANKTRLECLQPHAYSRESLIGALDCVEDLSEIETFSGELFRNSMYVDGYMHGNICEGDADELQEIIRVLFAEHKIRPLQREHSPAIDVLKIPTGTPLVVRRDSVDKQDRNNCVQAYYEIGECNGENKLIADLIEHIMEEPLYDELRTNQQLGYHVSCSVRQNETIIGFLIEVVSSTHKVDDIYEHIKVFLNNFLDRLEGFRKNQNSYEENVHTLAELKLADDVNMQEASEHLWDQIFSGELRFHRHITEAIGLKRIKVQKVIDAFKSWLWPQSKESRLLLIFIRGQGSSLKAGEPTEEDSKVPTHSNDFTVLNPDDVYDDCTNYSFYTYKKPY